MGRNAFDMFLRKFFVDFAFRSLTTEQFVAYAREQLPDCPVDYDEWLNGEGLPASSPVIASDLLGEIRSVGQTVVEPSRSRTWDATAWSVYLAQQGTHDDEYFIRMDEEYDLTHSTNPELHRLWLLAGVRSGYQGAIDASAAFLASTGRMK